ncbi:transglycosylase domain-containing protein [Thermanaeromonas sp. C210]|uniref:transglycosylase domain-containing protein n=1 Tax=Thermanaeromonas sp. C210 TaxID=2731925 RepID=UPI00155BBBA5|nr:PBP1A family penicillin-binding protein [Thermanaeromonas sp. C210]GFN23174.1 penicillin-binding protein 1A [Thermanaeromonas sp. C210]
MPADKKKTRRRLNLKRLLLLLAAVVVLAGIGSGIGLAFDVLRGLPSWDPNNLRMDLTTSLYDKDNNLFATLHGEQNRLHASLEEIPKYLQDAVIAIEDVRFYQHHGIDLRSIARAAVTNLLHRQIREGGSTITQQLAKNAFIEDWERTFRRKIQEAILALQIERVYTKEEILEHYLNIVYLGPGIYGVKAAAEAYFGKDVQDLTLAESALIAGIIQSPARYSPLIKNNEKAAKERQATVLANMVKYGFISQAEADQALQQELVFNSKPPTSTPKYPYFVDAVIEEASRLLEENGISAGELFRGGLHVYTTLDPKVQAKMEEVYANPANFPKSPSERLVESAMVVLDPHTGEIRGLVGGRQYTARRGLNRATQAERQPGSTIKPLVVYAPALERGFTPASVIDDVPTTFPGSPKPFTPRNYDGRYRGLISMREALRWSVNVAAVKMLHTIGVDTGWEYGRKLGLPLQEGDRNLSLALGGITSGVTPLQMAAAYGVFANGGVYVAPHTVTRITDRHGRDLVVNTPQQQVIMSEQMAYLMTDMLQTVVKSGTGQRAQIGRPVAGKTGTTSLPDLPAFRGVSGEKDAWFVGYTPELVAAVWMGYDQTDPQHYLRGVAGGSYPALIWRQVMQEALKGVPVQNFPRPSGIVYADVDAKSGLLPSDLTPKEFIVKEIFTADTVPKKVSDVWVQLEVCATTGQLASPHCPQLTTGVFLRRPVPYTGSVQPEDAYLEAPKEVCTLHSSGEARTVLICTDPRHGGKPVLANVPGPGQQGGCPSEYVQSKEFAPGTAPTEHCNLPEHQLGEGSSGEPAPPPAPELQVQVDVELSSGRPEVKLSWHTGGEGEYLYSVERRENGSRKNLTITRDTTYVDTGVKPGRTYTYRVLAVDPATQISTPSNEVTVNVPAGPNRKKAPET